MKTHKHSERGKPNVVLGTTLGFLILTVSPLSAEVGDTNRASLPDPSTGNAQANDDSAGLVGISDGGRFVVFNSTAENLVTTPVLGQFNSIYLHDRETGATELVTVNAAGENGNSSAYEFDITPDGRYVVFESWATNLDGSACTGNGTADIFLRDRVEDTTECISFHSDGATVGNGRSQFPRISDDGNVIAYASRADNLVDGDTNGAPDVFVHYRNTGETRRVSVSSSGAQSAIGAYTFDLSGNGAYVVFASEDEGLDPADSNGYGDLFLHDLSDGTTELIGFTSTGAQLNRGAWYPRINYDGSIVSFKSVSSNLASEVGGGQIYVIDVANGDIEAVNVNELGEGGGFAVQGDISADGRFVVYQTNATNLDPRDSSTIDTNVYVRDREAGVTSLVDVSTTGEKASPPPVAHLATVAISADGRFIAFNSPGENLVPDDTNGVWDVFVHQIEPFTPVEMLEDIIEEIIDLNLDAGISNTVDGKLNAALDALVDTNENNDGAACGSLNALLQSIDAQEGRQLTAGEAKALRDDVQPVYDSLECE